LANKLDMFMILTLAPRQMLLALKRPSGTAAGPARRQRLFNCQNAVDLKNKYRFKFGLLK
jgi:hypothetical protein